MSEMQKEVKLNERQKRLLAHLIERGDLDVKTITESQNVSPATVYNDLKLFRGLSFDYKEGTLSLRSNHDFVETHFDYRLWLNREVKERIARHIVQQQIIQNGDSIFLDCGSSMAILSETIVTKNISGLTVFTNNPTALKKLYYYTGISRLVLVGGYLDSNDSSLYGEFTCKFLQNLEVGYRKLFLGVDNISPSGEIEIRNDYEIEQKKIMIKNAKEVYVLADESKIDNVNCKRVGNIRKLRESGKCKKDICLVLVGLLGNEPKESTLRLKQELGDAVVLIGEQNNEERPGEAKTEPIS